MSDWDVVFVGPTEANPSLAPPTNANLNQTAPFPTAANPAGQGIRFDAPPAPPDSTGGLPTLDPSLRPIMQRESGGKPFVGYTPPGQSPVDLSNAPLDDTGFPIWGGNVDPKSGLRSHAAGLFQIQRGTWRPIAQKLGIHDFSPESQIRVANELRREQGLTPWAASAPGGWDVVSAGNWKPSDTGILAEMAKPDTSVIGGSFDLYKALTGLSDEDTDARKQKRLDKSLNAGEEIETPPAIDVKVKDGKAYVTDQDGFHRAQKAAEAGVDFMPIALHGLKPGEKITAIVTPQGKEIPYTFQAYPQPMKAPSRGAKFLTGVNDVLVGAGQLAAHLGVQTPVAGMPEFGVAAPGAMTEQVSAQDIDKAVAAREAAYERGRQAAGDTGTDWWRLAGNAAAMVPAAAVSAPSGIISSLGAGAATGAGAAAFQPVTNGDYWREKAGQVGTGAVVGAALGGAGNMLARVAQPYIQPAANRLAELGVRLTPGMMRGGAVKGAENRLSSYIPTMTGAVRRAIEDFNKAAYDKVLSRIGLKYEGSEVGYKGIDTVEKALSRAYDRVLPDIRFHRTPEFDADLANLRELAQEMPAGEAGQFEAIVNNRVLKRMGPEGAMDGQTFKMVESELSTLSRGLHRSEMAGQRQLGDAVDTLNGTLRQAVEDQNPKVAPELRRVNAAWAAFVRIRMAAANRSKSLGVFTPSDLLTASRRAAGQKVFARGDALMQDLAEDAERVIPNTYPDSGTTGRMVASALASGGAAHFLHPAAFLPWLALSGAYTRPGEAILRGIAGRGLPEVRNALARLSRATGASLAPAAGAVTPAYGANGLPYP